MCWTAKIVIKNSRVRTSKCIFSFCLWIYKKTTFSYGNSSEFGGTIETIIRYKSLYFNIYNNRMSHLLWSWSNTNLYYGKIWWSWYFSISRDCILWVQKFEIIYQRTAISVLYQWLSTKQIKKWNQNRKREKIQKYFNSTAKPEEW